MKGRAAAGLALAAGLAGQVLAADGDTVGEYRSHSEMAERAYAIADAMLRARSVTLEPTREGERGVG